MCMGEVGKKRVLVHSSEHKVRINTRTPSVFVCVRFGWVCSPLFITPEIKKNKESRMLHSQVCVMNVWAERIGKYWRILCVRVSSLHVSDRLVASHLSHRQTVSMLMMMTTMIWYANAIAPPSRVWAECYAVIYSRIHCQVNASSWPYINTMCRRVSSGLENVFHKLAGGRCNFQRLLHQTLGKYAHPVREWNYIQYDVVYCYDYNIHELCVSVRPTPFTRTPRPIVV